MALLIATPTALLFCALALVLTNVYAPKAAPPREVSAVDLMAKLLPDIEKTVNIYAYKDAEIVELRMLRDGAPRISGVLKNKTDHVISVECDIDLANVDGSRISTATERVEKAPALSSMPFEFPVHNPETAYALVRKMRTVQ